MLSKILCSIAQYFENYVLKLVVTYIKIVMLQMFAFAKLRETTRQLISLATIFSLYLSPLP